MKLGFSIVLFFASIAIVLAQLAKPLPPAKNHYAELKQLDSGADPQRRALEIKTFAPEQYNALALAYTLMAPTYLTSNEIDSLKHTVNYPANSSDQTRAELDFLLQWQTKRSPEQIKRTSKVLAPIGYWPHIDVKITHPDYQTNRMHLMFQGKAILGAECTPENYPATFKLLQGVTRDMRIMEFTVKYYLLRARPYVLEPKLEPLQLMGSPSFVSGHTLWAYLHAFVWAELVPEKRNQFLDLAYEIGESREIMGIHYPSDEEAARQLAYAMLTTMWQKKDFQSDLSRAKTEWK